MWENTIMYKQCNSEVTARRQRNLENCLLELMQTIAYEKIAVGDICAAANVPRGMFYRYFDSKKDALDALIDAYIEARPWIDRDRVYIGGCSNGGFMTMSSWDKAWKSYVTQIERELNGCYEYWYGKNDLVSVRLLQADGASLADSKIAAIFSSSTA